MWVVVFSVSVNVLLLVLPFYAIEVFDRVISSGSIETLIGLTVLGVAALIFSAFFDILRFRLLSRFAVRFEQHIAPLVLEAAIADPGRRREGTTHEIVKVRELRNFISSGALITLVDAPFLPFFVLILFFIHPYYGAIVLVGAVLLSVMGYASSRIARAEVTQASGAAARCQALMDGVVRHANFIRAMGWTGGAIRAVMRVNDEALAPVVRASERVAAIASAARMVRSILQILAIGTGAWLVLQNQVLLGTLIASSIMVSRTLQPMETLISAWRGMTAAQQAWKSVSEAADWVFRQPRRTQLPPPNGLLEISRLVYAAPQTRRPILAGIGFRCRPGEIVVVVGPTGAGKSTLLRMAAALERPSAGEIRLDRALLENWHPDQLGRYIGYLPQDVELLAGTVAEAISGFEENVRDEDIVAAATLAGAHEMILAMPGGYQTQVGRDGHRLSGGQRQRIGLARAFFGNRRLILLDEPNANLDPEGEAALCAAILSARARGASFLIVTHRPRLLTVADHVLLLRDGVQVAFGAVSDVLPTHVAEVTPIRRPTRQPERPRLSG
ncbi:type I secretion system permease/ATPase [Bradyrhizobium sp. AUGA SZCCT0240]|uniref:type I secretion system permease/ATPase n=1 Tax=unclassified Bradyrhizobium TaxID=2631580 RepID=UPI001BA44B29|nr:MULTISPECIES: type I secretion system permease/ATPase [unclassified Bradyrhizobium]MBR1195033.1 type I secretion system permease/ATPase [Bradyrhizobium sp. AUGA SZCCT0158]MBR1242807.1 type I secretion system permease/ATPase [Bradyrhizobium sp. AUGA SZCCT0274]MBR1252943.1 type I secretion system permease/ATPase [Bradyrhizobium sp. AUGA SZCCT0240]